MRVSDLTMHPLVSVGPDASLAEVAGRMRVADCGSAAVMTDGQLLGIITERDLVQAIADGINPRRTTAGFLMSADPVTARQSDDVAVVAMRMIALGIRHLPVVNVAGTPIGMISARSLSAALERPPAPASSDTSA